MARRVQVVLVDDVDGGEATETVVFALGGVQYEIDLSEANSVRLREDLGTWAASARRVGGRRRAGGGTPLGYDSGERQRMARVRQWGRDNGYEVSKRGRLSRELQDAYAAAH